MSAAGQSCTVFPVNPASLTSSGRVNNGTNVMVQCSCVDNENKSIRNIKWFFQNGSQLLDMKSVSTGAPYLMIVNYRKTATLVIPMFNDTYKGNYTCGKGQKLPIDPPNGIIQLLLSGKILL